MKSKDALPTRCQSFGFHLPYVSLRIRSLSVSRPGPSSTKGGEVSLIYWRLQGVDTGRNPTHNACWTSCQIEEGVVGRGLSFLRVQKHTAPKCLALSELKRFSDEELMESLKKGHQDALAMLFDRYHRLVLSIAWRILRDRTEAEDLMQEVFFEIYRRVGTFEREKGSAKAWILLYAYHRSLNRRRQLNARHFYDSDEISEVGSKAPSCSPSTWRGFTCEECSYLIQQVMVSLNEKQRRTLELACFEGFTLPEVARDMNESHSNVRHYYYRGLQKLRNFLLGASPSGTSNALPTKRGAHVR